MQYRTFMMVIVAATGLTGVAAAQDSSLSEVPSWFPPGLVQAMAPDDDHPRGGWQFDTFRAPQLTGDADTAVFSINYNGIDDETWAYPELLEVLLSNLCGKVDSGIGRTLVDATYDQPSEVPEENLGGNAGATMQMTRRQQIGQCEVEVRIAGARWHTIVTTITR